MKAIHITRPGSPEVLQVVDVPTPEITSSTGVRVKLHAAGINPVDTKMRSGAYPVDPFPAILGCDGAGVVMDNVGGDVFRQSFPAVRVYGDLVTLLLIPPDVDWSVARFRNLRISQEVMLSPLLLGLEDAQRHQTWIVDQCARLFDSGKLRIHVERVYPFDHIAEAHRAIETASTRGKLVLAIP